MSNPPISLYGSSYPVARAALETLTTLLNKGQETANANDLPQARLYENMAPLTAQVQYICNIIRNLVSRTTGQDLASVWADDATLSTFEELHARVALAKGLVDAVNEDVVNSKANETFTMKTNTYGTVHVCVHTAVSTHILPYLFFYLGNTYGILRKEGVPLQMMDFMGAFNNIAIQNPGLMISQPAKMGHINMMDDVIIGNLPPEHLRSVVRSLLSTGPEIQTVFRDSVRQRLLDFPPGLPEPTELFPFPDMVSPVCAEYLAVVRCTFSAKLVLAAFPSLCHVIEAIPLAKASWVSGSPLDLTLERVDGDVVQAMQAIKEAPPSSDELEASLDNVFAALSECQKYCEATGLRYPFQRCTRQVQDTASLLLPNKTSQRLNGPSTLSVKISDAKQVETFKVGERELPRLFNGLWQMASPEWGASSAEQQEQALVALVESGFTAFDMSDHYGDAELVCGDFRARLPENVGGETYMATKWCVFRDIQRPVTTEWVLEQVNERCRRLSGRADMLQFHWYDYEKKEYLDILVELVKITKSHPELVTHIGLCNFDSKHTAEACEYLIKNTGFVGIVSNQVQFSVLDSRPLKEMVQTCARYNLKLLTYGSFCGGFLADKWLSHPTPPDSYGQTPLTPSQRKYLDTLSSWGTWSDFQALLAVLDGVAKRHGVAVANVAARWVLQQESVGAVLVGTRLGVSARGDDNLATFGWELTEEDMDQINAAALGRAGEKTDAIFGNMGDCGQEYRNMHK
ncbi:hypothetical protein PWT90_09401 [Aphanocladium album]|nr:hypothetical protein PWT90_09401 [Aphanocladium album]